MTSPRWIEGFRPALPAGADRRRDPVGLPHHPDEHRPQRPILPAVDQELGEGATLRVAPILADPLATFEVGQREEVKQFGAASGSRESRRSRSRCSTGRVLSSGIQLEPPIVFRLGDARSHGRRSCYDAETRSLKVEEARTSDGPAKAAIRAPI